MIGSYGQLTPAITYDLTSSGTLGGYGAWFLSERTKKMRTEATTRVNTALQGVISRGGIPRFMKRQPENNLEAMYASAFWMASGAMRIGFIPLAEKAKQQLDLAVGYADSWVTSPATGVDKIPEILSSGANNCARAGATVEAKALKNLILGNLQGAPEEEGLTKRGTKAAWQALLPDFLQGKLWIFPVGIGLLVLLPPLIRLIGRKRA